jgi:hypothetical protein
MFITGEVGELFMEKLEIKNDNDNTALLSMNDATGLLQSLKLSNVVFDGENNARSAIAADNGKIFGEIDIQNCDFKNIVSKVVIDTVKDAVLHTLNPGYLSKVVFSSNTVSNSKGHVAFRGRLDQPIETVTISSNTMNGYLSGTSADSALVITMAKDVDLTLNTIEDVKEVTDRGMGHAIATWSTHDGWTLDLSKNNINNNAGGVLIATDIHGKSTTSGASTNLGAATFYVPKGKANYNSFTNNKYFGFVIADVKMVDASATTMNF